VGKFFRYALCALRYFVMANLFVDDTVSAYLSLIHSSKPDTDVIPGN